MRVPTVVGSWLIVGLVSPAAPALKGPGSGNLVVNGSFEEGLVFEGFRPLDPDATDVKGWVVTRGQIDVVQETGGKLKAADGNRHIDLHGSPGFGGVKQSIETRAGRKYRLTFEMSGNPGVPMTTAKLMVRAAGAEKEFRVDMAGRTLEDLKWEKMTWEFTATERTTVLEIHTAMPPTSNAFGGPLLDDVRVVVID